MVREVSPVGRVEEDEVGAVARRNPPPPVGPAQDVRCIDGAGGERLRGRQLELRRRQRAADRQALAECAARVEVGREGDRGARVDEGAPRRHRPTEEERARRQEHSDDVARRKCAHTAVARRLEVVDGARAQLDCERDRALFGELVAVQAERETGVAACFEEPARLSHVERPALEEDVGRLR